jgi:DNA-binding SARP family transcriptional activator
VATGRRRESRESGFHQTRLRLLTEFQLLVDGNSVTLPHSVERVLAFLGISQAPVSRARIAGVLWPDVADKRANGDLRSALWRLRRITGVVREENRRLALAPQVAVDVVEMTDLTRSLIFDPDPAMLDSVPALVHAHAILPGWDEEWLVVERERFRMTRLRALERSAQALLTGGDLEGALDAALASVDTEPYRETAHRLVVQIHIAEGNHAQAIRTYQAYRSQVAAELGIAPSARMDDLVAPLSQSRSRAPEPL